MKRSDRFTWRDDDIVVTKKGDGKRPEKPGWGKLRPRRKKAKPGRGVE